MICELFNSVVALAQVNLQPYMTIKPQANNAGMPSPALSRCLEHEDCLYPEKSSNGKKE
jgi:hypothetical protein